MDCGKIGSEYFVPSLAFYAEAKYFNTCLNRKISLSSDGFLKNCPSFKNNFGHIAQKSILDTINDQNFKKYWTIRKDEVQVCCNCEFRYVCSDCRVFIVHEENPFSKPSKCKYNPLH